MARRTKDDAEKTRNAILDAAENVFFARGVTRSSLEQIAEQAGVTRGAVYWHFKDKIELCDAMARRIFLPHEDMLKELTVKSSDQPLKDLENSCVHTLRLLAKDKRRREACSVLMLRCEYVEEMSTIVHRNNQSINRMLYLAIQLLSRARDLGQLSHLWTPHNAAVATQGLLIGLIQAGLEQRKGFALSTVGVSCIKSFFASLTTR